MSAAVKVADLFCGAGGTSTGIAQAAEVARRTVEITAVNHWPTAVETHSANHANARHLCESLDNINPKKLFPDGLDILVASPECTNHSNARGGKPMCDQSRSTAWHVLRWAEALQPKEILVENVREFLKWGPIGKNGRPIKSQEGRTFKAWAQGLRSLGYRVDWRVLNAADYGDPTTRNRLFVRATKGRGAVRWPEQSHSESPDLFSTERWKPARDIIDWSVASRSIFGRKKPLAVNTIARIEAGLRKFGGEAAEPFLVVLRQNADGRSLNKPLPTVTASGQHMGLCEPFLVRYNGGDGRVHELTRPIPVIDTNPRYGLCEPFIIQYYGSGEGAKAIGNPLPTITTRDRFGVVEPCAFDLRFRMLQPHELAAAMSFPAGYKFAGTKTEIVRQIGNAVPVSIAQALCSEMIG